MKKPTKEQLRVLLKVGFGVLGVFYVALFFFMPRELDGFVIWLNGSNETSSYWLDIVRSLSAVVCATAMWSLGRLMLKFPTTKRFYLFFVPLPFAFSYYLAQVLVTTSEVIPRRGFVLMNISGTLILAGFSVMAALLAYYYKDKEHIS